MSDPQDRITDLAALRVQWPLLEVAVPDTAADVRGLLEIFAGAVAHALHRVYGGRRGCRGGRGAAWSGRCAGWLTGPWTGGPRSGWSTTWRWLLRGLGSVWRLLSPRA
ncbi:hypothetical protein, partial [Streptomyces chilikensis]